MKARLATMEQLVEKLVVEVGTLRKENESLKGATNKPGHNVEPSNSEHIGSRNAGGEGETKDEKRNMHKELRNLKEKYKEMVRKIGTSSLVDKLLTSSGLLYSEEVMVIPLPPKF